MRASLPTHWLWPFVCVLNVVCVVAHAAPTRITAGCGDIISFRQGLEAAWNNDPVRRELAVNASSARARAAAARSWFAGGPSFAGSYYDDRAAGTNIGYVTWEGTLTVPLWLPGQGTATETVAKADAAKALAQVEVARMSIAVRVLQQAQTFALAQRRLTIAKAFENAFSRMVALTTRAVRAGEGTSADLQAVSAQLSAARAQISLDEAAFANAQGAQMTLLGIPGKPDLFQADSRWLARSGQKKLADIEDHDPRVMAAHRDVAAAEAQMQLAQHSYMPNPEVGLMALNQGQYASPWSTQVGATVRITLPSDVTQTPLLSSAQDRLAAASRAEVMARRAVHDELVQVITSVNSARAALEDARSGATQTLQRADALEHAWTLGETPLIEALRARTEAWHALLTLNESEVAFHSAVVRLCIATGTVP